MTSFLLDDNEIAFEKGDTLMTAARRSGVHIPHLCWHPALGQSGACRVCTVKVNGRMAAACTTRAASDMIVENSTKELEDKRRLLVQMLFVEGNHLCPGCEKSGDCLLQETAYDLGMTDPHFEEFYPRRPVDASHTDAWIDFDRCILCKLCVRASNEIDHKGVFAVGGYGIHTHLLIDSPTGRLGDSAFSMGDFAAKVCPVGAILPKRHGFVIPIGERRFDRHSLADEARHSSTDPHSGAPSTGKDHGDASETLAAGSTQSVDERDTYGRNRQPGDDDGGA